MSGYSHGRCNGTNVPVDYQISQLYGYIYKVFLAGRTIVIVTHPDGIASITRDTTKYLTHKDIFIHMLRGITGFSGDVNLIHDLLDSKIFPITKLTLSPSSMQDVTASFDRLLLRQLRSLKSVNDRTRTIKLSDLIGRPLYIAGCYALFGSTFPLQTFCDFQKLDSDLPQLLTQLPFVGRRGAQARERLLSSIIGYIQPWWDSDIVEDLPEASATVMQSLAELKASQVTIREAAGTLLLLLWGFHSNTWYMLFWLMTHLVADESAMSCLLTDIGISELGHVPKDSEHNIHHPLLDSAILEILRWATTSTTVRYAEEDTQITVDGNNVPINKGEYVMGDVRAVHHDFSTFKDPDQFKIDRYLSEGGTAHSLPKPMAWGGGKHMVIIKVFSINEIYLTSPVLQVRRSTRRNTRYAPLYARLSLHV